MNILDLSCGFSPATVQKIKTREIPLKSDQTAYTGMVYDLEVNSMDGSYIDLPGHIRETDRGERADNLPPENFYRVSCSVIRLNRESGSGAVSGAELESAFGGKVRTPALIINALGSREPDEIDNRSVWLDFSALDWIIRCGIRLLVSDIYESKRLDGVFLKLFAAGVSTVCMPENLFKIPDEVLLTIAFPRWPTTQIPCVLLAEYQE